MSKKFPGVSGVGGYTVSYVGDGVIYCADCANKVDKDEQDSLKPYTHWEGDSLSCEECGEEIESEYG